MAFATIDLIDKIHWQNQKAKLFQLNFGTIAHRTWLDQLYSQQRASNSNADTTLQKNGFTPRTLETVRSKMRRLGLIDLIDHVSRFNKAHGHREDWIFSNRSSRSLNHLSDLIQRFRDRKDPLQERKDRDLFAYI